MLLNSQILSLQLYFCYNADSYDKKDLFFEWENDQTGIRTDLQTSEFKVISFYATANIDLR